MNIRNRAIQYRNHHRRSNRETPPSPLERAGVRLKITLFFSLMVIALTSTISTHAQAIDNTTSYKNINSDAYFRLNYENDFFSATDEYYTQGINIETVGSFWKKNPVNYILIKPKYDYIRYGLGFQHNGYTPSDIGHNEILYGDRPFAGTIMLQSFLIATNTEKHRRFTSSLSTGVIGPLAGAGQMQRDIHKWLNNITPHGWDNQIQNDIILNYQVNFEQQLLAYKKSFLLSADAFARAGTLSDKAGIGITLMFGYFNSPYDRTETKNKNFRIYAYEHPGFNVVGYDATLQGGVFDKDSPYTISSGDINRIVFQNRFGFVVHYQGFSLEYFQSVNSREFETQKMHTWGGVQVSFGL